jgi:sigma-E factor negative regulatory protein RseA
MTDQINDQISAFIDNELSAEESALLVRRFERDPEARARVMRYTLIGAALRGELLEPHPSVLRQRVTAALSGTTPGLARARSPWAQRLARPALGVGIAAAVAFVAIGTLRTLNQASPAPGVGSAAAVTPLQARDAAEAPSYVVPGETAEALAVTPPIRLTNYLMHHGEYASGLTRTMVNSNVVGAAVERPVEETASSKPVIMDRELVE